jgi:hypothetical protein
MELFDSPADINVNFACVLVSGFDILATAPIDTYKGVCTLYLSKKV